MDISSGRTILPQEKRGRNGQPMTQILAVTCMRDEGPYAAEWIAHLLAVGIGHVLVYSHDCADGTDRLLDLMAASGRVTHVPFAAEGNKSVQWQALRLADKHPLVRAADWVIFLDADECPVFDAPLTGFTDLIAALPEETEAVALPWRLFGSAGKEQFEEGLTPERFTRAAPADVLLPAAHFFKSLIRPRAFQKLGVHRPKNKKETAPRWSLGGALDLDPPFATDDSRINLFGYNTPAAKARLNHYSLRSAEEFLAKRARGLPNQKGKPVDLGYWAERNFNSVEDISFARHLPAMKEKLAELLALSGVADAITQARDCHKAQIARLLTEPANARLLWHMMLFAGSTPPSREALERHIKRLNAPEPS